MRRLIAAIAVTLLVSVPALAKPITLTLNDQEQARLIELLDLATKSGGLGVAQYALPLVLRIQQEQQRPDAPPPAATPPAEK